MLPRGHYVDGAASWQG